MDIRDYFNSVDFAAFYNSNHLNWKYTLGAAIEKNTHAVTKENIHKTNVAIIGVPFDSGKEGSFSTNAPGKIRDELYQLAKFESKINIADFGDLKPASSVKGNYQALRDIVDYFNELKIVTLVIGGSQDLSVGICEAFRGNPWFSFSTIDSFLDVKKAKEPFNSFNYLSRLFIGQPQIFQFNLIGFQGHYLASENIGKIKSIGQHIRLGNLRNSFSHAEPILRNTDFLSFDINSVKYSEAPGVLRPNPNGLRSEEACQLAKYAGFSSRLKVFGMFDVIPENDLNNITVKLSAQILWYFLEGYINRDNEKPGAGENSITYQVEVDNVDKPIVFFKDSITGRWWMEIETTENRRLCFACSEREYEQASNNEIPELWLKYIQKIDEQLK